MTKDRKIELLYRKAKGQAWDASPAEKQELRKYKVGDDDGNFATKANIAAYVTAVDQGYRLAFYDWCRENKKADRRRKGSSEAEMAQFNSDQNKATMFIGWLVWGIALYWIAGGELPVGACAVAGAIVSLVLFRIARKAAAFTLIVLPIALAAIFFYIR